MSETYKSEISHDEYLQALALFVMASNAQSQCCEYTTALNKIIMETLEPFPGGHVDDAIYADGGSTAADFDEALRRQGINVAKPMLAEREKTRG